MLYVLDVLIVANTHTHIDIDTRTHADTDTVSLLSVMMNATAIVSYLVGGEEPILSHRIRPRVGPPYRDIEIRI